MFGGIRLGCVMLPEEMLGCVRLVCGKFRGLA
jgi:hypothetical protein